MSNEEGNSSQAINQGNPNLTHSDSVHISIGNENSTNHERLFSPIYEVPSILRDVNPSSFTPRMVSIGPMHKGRANLKLMEGKKETYQNELLEEVAGSPDETLTRCKRKVTDKIKKIRTYYFGKTFEQELDSNEFTRMMVLDACYILQFLNKLSKSGNELHNNRLRSRSVAVDLVLLENQIPFFVLQDIYDLTLGILRTNSSLTEMLLGLLERVNPFLTELKIENISDKKTHFHILGLLHEFYKPDSYHTVPEIKAIPTAHSAVELHKVGVKFRPNDYPNWPLNMEFGKPPHKTTFTMPKVFIDNFFEVVMRNLIAYEQYSHPVKNYVSSYAMAMGMLAATPADIAKLAESDVLVNNLGSSEKASDMISSICKDVTFPDFYYIESWTKAKEYYDSFLKKNWGVFKRKYFSTPWKAIALLAGIILFFASMTDFVFRIIKH